MRDAITDAPSGIQRIALTLEGHKIERRMLGSAGAVKLWPAGTTLVVGEGLETVLAAATRIPHHGAPLQPAWALLTEWRAWAISGPARHRAIDHPGRQRSQRHRASRRRHLHQPLAAQRPQRHQTHAQARRY